MVAVESPGFKIKDNQFLIFSIFTATIGSISDGMHLAFPCPFASSATNASILDQTKSNFNTNTNSYISSSKIYNDSYPTDKNYQMLAQSFYMAGALAGIFLKIIFRKFCPKLSITLSSVISLISWVLIASHSHILALFAARILAGIALMSTLTTVPNYLQEISTKIIGKLVKDLIYYGMLLGILIIYILGPICPYISIPIIGAVIVLVQIVLSFFISDSPYFLLSKNKLPQAESVLKRLRNNQTVQKELVAIRNLLIQHSKDKRSPKILATKENKRATLTVIVAASAQQFTGITVFVINLYEILSQCGTTLTYRMIVSIMFIIILVVVGYLHQIEIIKSNDISDIIGAIVCTIALLVLGIYFTVKKYRSGVEELSWLPILSIILYSIAFRFDKGYSLNEIVENVYPRTLILSGYLVITFTRIVSSWITIEIFQRLGVSLGYGVPFFIFAVSNLVHTIVMQFCLPSVRKVEIRRSKYFRRNSGEFKEDDGNGEGEGESSELIDELQPSTSSSLKPSDMTVAPEPENIFKGTFPQLVAVLAGTLTAISDGMQYGWTSPVLPILLGPDSPVEVTKKQGEWLETLLMLGSFSGLWITIYLVDRLGRKRSILLASFVTLVIWIITAVAPRVEYIFVARAFAGSAGNMAFVATPMYIAEIAEQKIRGFLSSLIYLMMLVGILLIYAVAPYVPFYVHCIIGAVLAFTELCIFPFMPESPYYLLYKDQPEAARESLKRLRAPGFNIDKELEDIKAAVDRQKAERGKIQDLILVPSNRKAMLIMALLNAAQHFSSISVLLMNIHAVLEAAGSIYLESRIAAILFAVIMVIAASTASFFMDRFGRRALLLSSSILSGTCLLILALYFSLKNGGYNIAGVSWIPIVCVMLYACFFKLGLGMVPIVLTAELFPTKMKAFGMTIADGFYVIASILSLQVYQRLHDSLGMQYPFYVFSISCIIAAVFTYFFIPETKGKTLEEIQMILKGKHLEKQQEETAREV